MFTVKLMRDVRPDSTWAHTNIVEASTIQIHKREHPNTPPDVAIIIDSGKPTEFWYYITNEDADGHYRLGVVENSLGKTTQVIHP